MVVGEDLAVLGQDDARAGAAALRAGARRSARPTAAPSRRPPRRCRPGGAAGASAVLAVLIVGRAGAGGATDGSSRRARRTPRRHRCRRHRRPPAPRPGRRRRTGRGRRAAGGPGEPGADRGAPDGGRRGSGGRRRHGRTGRGVGHVPRCRRPVCDDPETPLGARLKVSWHDASPDPRHRSDRARPRPLTLVPGGRRRAAVIKDGGPAPTRLEGHRPAPTPCAAGPATTGCSARRRGPAPGRSRRRPVQGRQGRATKVGGGGGDDRRQLGLRQRASTAPTADPATTSIFVTGRDRGRRRRAVDDRI